MNIKGVELPCVGSTSWHKLIKDIKRAGLYDHATFKALVKASNAQHDGTLKTGKIKAQQLDKHMYTGARGIGAARSFKPAPTARPHSRISASVSLF